MSHGAPFTIATVANYRVDRYDSTINRNDHGSRYVKISCQIVQRERERECGGLPLLKQCFRFTRRHRNRGH